jgi:hypothetical protein
MIKRLLLRGERENYIGMSAVDKKEYRRVKIVISKEDRRE